MAGHAATLGRQMVPSQSSSPLPQPSTALGLTPTRASLQSRPQRVSPSMECSNVRPGIRLHPCRDRRCSDHSLRRDRGRRRPHYWPSTDPDSGSHSPSRRTRCLSRHPVHVGTVVRTPCRFAAIVAWVRPRQATMRVGGSGRPITGLDTVAEDAIVAVSIRYAWSLHVDPCRAVASARERERRTEPSHLCLPTGFRFERLPPRPRPSNPPRNGCPRRRGRAPACAGRWTPATIEQLSRRGLDAEDGCFWGPRQNPHERRAPCTGFRATL